MQGGHARWLEYCTIKTIKSPTRTSLHTDVNRNAAGAKEQAFRKYKPFQPPNSKSVKFYYSILSLFVIGCFGGSRIRVRRAISKGLKEKSGDP